MPRTILVTGSEGYLASQLIDKLLARPDVERIIGVDIRESSERAEHEPRYTYIRASVTDTDLVERLRGEEIDTAVHTAWTFDPIHDTEAQDEVDITGTRNILALVTALGIPHLYYLGSTTCYAPLPGNPQREPFLKEEEWNDRAEERMSTAYRYSRNKAIGEQVIQAYSEAHPEKTIGWMRGAIAIGPKTRNIVSYMAESPFTFGLFMFSVAGYDPPMQYVSEEDMLEVMYRATMEGWRGPVNVAGEGTLRYSEVVRTLGRIRIPLPSFVLYPFVWLLWHLRIFKFPPSLLDLIRYPWVGDITRLRETFGFKPTHTSRQALEQFARARLQS